MSNEFPNIVSIAGKKLSWKNPNIKAAIVKIPYVNGVPCLEFDEF
jgi:hypothetical protein